MSSYRENLDSLTPDRRLELEQIEKLVFDVKEQQWNTAFEYLKRYQQEYGDCLVPNNCKVDGFGLGYWVGHQRKDAYGSLTQSKRQKLDSLGFV